MLVHRTHQEALYFQIMTRDPTDDEVRTLARHLRQAIDYARYPLAPRLDPLKAILATPAGTAAAAEARDGADTRAEAAAVNDRTSRPFRS